MTVTYCGTCGTAHTAAAKFCRHCGAEFSAQPVAVISDTPKVILKSVNSVNAVNDDSLAMPLPEIEIIPLAPTVSVIEPRPATAEESRHASDNLGHLREAKIIEARKEEETREYKKAAELQPSDQLAHAPVSVPETGAKAAPEPAEDKSPIPLITPQRLKNPLVPILPQKVESKPENKPAIEIVRRNSGALLDPANALQKVKEQNRSALAVRAAASMLGLALLLGGFYAYRHPVFSGNLIGGVRNLLSPEEQSAQLLQASRSDLEAGNVEEATQKLERAVALAPNELLTREQLAEAYAQRGRTEDALSTLDGLLKLAPEHLDARLKLAALQQRRGNLHEARAQFQKIIQLDQSSPQAVQALEAIETIDSSLNAPMQARNNNDTARLRRDNSTKRLGPALPVIASARPAAPQAWRPPTTTNNYFDWSPRRGLEAPDPRLVATMHKETGIRYFNIREYNAALRELQEAVRLTPNDKDLYYFLGGAYRGLGQSLKAFDHYKRCDSGTYAAVAQSGAHQIEKAARKEYDKLQQVQRTPSTEANAEIKKDIQRNQALENLSAPIIAPFGGRAAFNPSSKE